MSEKPIDKIEALGRAVEAGTTSLDDAVAVLMAEHSLTPAGARDLLTNWKTARGAFEAAHAAAREDLSRFGS